MRLQAIEDWIQGCDVADDLAVRSLLDAHGDVITPAGGRELSNENQASDQMAGIIHTLLHERS